MNDLLSISFQFFLIIDLFIHYFFYYYYLSIHYQ